MVDPGGEDQADLPNDLGPQLQGRGRLAPGNIIANLQYSHEHGTDRPEIINWNWPY
jgi:hypothetical protein